jgi:hypothetical protein
VVRCESCSSLPSDETGHAWQQGGCARRQLPVTSSLPHILQRLRSDDSTGQATAVQNMLTRLRFDYTSSGRDLLVSMWAKDGHAARAS